MTLLITSFALDALMEEKQVTSTNPGGRISTAQTYVHVAYDILQDKIVYINQNFNTCQQGESDFTFSFEDLLKSIFYYRIERQLLKVDVFEQKSIYNVFGKTHIVVALNVDGNDRAETLSPYDFDNILLKFARSKIEVLQLKHHCAQCSEKEIARHTMDKAIQRVQIIERKLEHTASILKHIKHTNGRVMYHTPLVTKRCIFRNKSQVARARY